MVFDSGKLQTVTELQKSYSEWDLCIISPSPSNASAHLIIIALHPTLR